MRLEDNSNEDEQSVQPDATHSSGVVPKCDGPVGRASGCVSGRKENECCWGLSVKALKQGQKFISKKYSREEYTNYISVDPTNGANSDILSWENKSVSFFPSSIFRVQANCFICFNTEIQGQSGGKIQGCVRFTIVQQKVCMRIWWVI